MFLKLRQQYFEAFEASYSFAKDLYQSMGKSKGHWQIYNATEGMKVILQDLRFIWQYDADDNRYLGLIARSANRVNILVGQLHSGKFRELLVELYNQLVNLIPEGYCFQLSLFDEIKGHAAFGWRSDFGRLVGLEKLIISFKNFFYSDKVRQFLSAPSAFKSYQGTQLNLSRAKNNGLI